MVAKPGLDGHDRGAKVVARALRDAGVEVVYTGLHQTPEQIVETAIQEDADAIGMSVLSGAHMTLFRKVIDLLAARDAGDIVVFGGGIVPAADLPALTEMGVAKIFTPGATTGEIIGWVRENLGTARPVLTRAAQRDRRTEHRQSQQAGPVRPGEHGHRLDGLVVAVGRVGGCDHDREPVAGLVAVRDAGQLDGHGLGDVGDPGR